MEKRIFANDFLKLLTYLVSLLLLTCLTIRPVFADSASVTGETDVTIDKIRIHMEMTGLKDTEIDEKLRQFEEKVGTGMSFKDSCAHCHVRQGG